MILSQKCRGLSVATENKYGGVLVFIFVCLLGKQMYISINYL